MTDPRRRPRLLTLLAVGANLLGVFTASVAVALAHWESKIYLTADEARLFGLLIAYGIVSIVAGYGMLRLRPYGRWLQILVSGAWLVAWAIVAVAEQRSGPVMVMLPGALLAAASLFYLSRASVSERFAEGAPVSGGRGLLIADALIAILAFFVVYPNLRTASGRSPVKRTMSELRNIATAVEAYATDHNRYPAARSIDDLIPQISPTYMRTVPRLDGWKNAIRYEAWTEKGPGLDRYAIASGGRDRTFEQSSLRQYARRASNDLNADIVYSNGDFVSWFATLAERPAAPSRWESPPIPLFDRGTALYRASQHQQAIPLFQEFLRAEPDHPLAHARLGLSLAEVGRDQDAIIHLQRAVQLDANDFQSRNNLALVYERIGKPELGIEPAREAARLKPREPIVQNTLGLVLLQAGRLDEAIGALQAAAQLAPRDGHVRTNLARAYHRRGYTERARAQIAVLRQIDRRAAEALEAEFNRRAQ